MPAFYGIVDGMKRGGLRPKPEQRAGCSGFFVLGVGRWSWAVRPQSRYLLFRNFPIPSLISNVLIPGLKSPKPAFEICR